MLKLNHPEQKGTKYDTSTWERYGKFSVVPEGMYPLTAVNYVIVGESVSIGDDAAIGARAAIGDGVYIDSHAAIGDDVCIGDNATIGGYATIGDFVTIGRETTIGDFATIGHFATIGRETTIGYHAIVGTRATIDDCAVIGRSVRIGDFATIGDWAIYIADIGHADGYRKTLCDLDGIAYIGAGCRWFCLQDALNHWSNHQEDRRATMALMQSAKALADLHGLKYK